MKRTGGWGSDFETLEGSFATFRTFGRNTFSLALEYKTFFGDVGDIDRLYSLGGFARLSGFARGELTGNHLGLLRLMWYRQLTDPTFFAWRFPLYFGATFEAGNTWTKRSDIDDILLSTTAFFGLETPLGPLYVGYAYVEGGRHRGYLFLGFPF